MRSTGRVAIVGGGGFVGVNLATDCVKHGFATEVTCVDVCFDGDTPYHDGGRGGGTIQRVICDLADPDCTSLLERVFEDTKCVFLVASYGMSGADQLNVTKIRAVNVCGTRRVLEACRAARVPSLVYCSTYNAVFVGQRIEGLGETELPYPADHQFVDEYSRTKSLAERIVLDANHVSLRTCCIRPAAIWGAGEKRHFARVNKLIDSGIFCFRYGNPIVDFVHVSNLTRAFILAGNRLQDRDEDVAGFAFFVSDDNPQNGFEFFCKLKNAKGRGDMNTLLNVPYWIVYAAAIFFEVLHRLTGMRWQPWMLTRAEVMKSGITHFVSIERAKRHLGYEPSSYSFQEVIDQWCNSNSPKKRE